MKNFIKLLTSTTDSRLCGQVPMDLLKEWQEQYRDLVYTVRVKTKDADFGIFRSKGLDGYITRIKPDGLPEKDFEDWSTYQLLAFKYNPTKDYRITGRDVLVAILLDVLDLDVLESISNTQVYSAIRAGRAALRDLGTIVQVDSNQYLDVELEESDETPVPPAVELTRYARFYSELHSLNPLVDTVNALLEDAETNPEHGILELIEKATTFKEHYRVNAVLITPDVTYTLNVPERNVTVTIKGNERVLATGLSEPMVNTIAQIFNLFTLATQPNENIDYVPVATRNDLVWDNLNRVYASLIDGSGSRAQSRKSGIIRDSEPEAAGRVEHDIQPTTCRIDFTKEGQPTMRDRVSTAIWYGLTLGVDDSIEGLCEEIYNLLGNYFTSDVINKVSIARRVSNGNDLYVNYDGTPILTISF